MTAWQKQQLLPIRQNRIYSPGYIYIEMDITERERERERKGSHRVQYRLTSMPRRWWMFMLASVTQPSGSKREGAESKESEEAAGVWEPLWDECLHSDPRYKSDPNQVNKSRHWSRYNNECHVDSALDILSWVSMTRSYQKFTIKFI